MNHDLLLIIPAYNEEACIGTFLRSLLSSPVTTYADILVINDASYDRTPAIVKELGITIINHPYNLGYGAALQTGYKYAVKNSYRYLIQLDGDGQHDICNVERIYNALKQKENPPDLVIGTRFHKESHSFPISPIKKFAIHFFQKMISITSKEKITDPTSGLQGMTRKVFQYYAGFRNFDTNYPDANMLVQLTLLGYQIKEIPAVMHPRVTGKSMHFGIIEPFLYMCIMIFSTFNVLVRNRKKKGKFLH